MMYVYLIGIPLALLALFLTLVAFEGRTDRRLFAGRRYELDTKAARAAFVLAHVDWGAFVNDIARTSFDRLLHDIAHTTLIVVRAIERELTGVVRTLRARREHPGIAAPRDAQPSRVQSVIAYMQRTVRRSRKQLPPPSAPREEDGE